ncbi:MAG: branched-chain amino acid ABC transporter permease [Gaiellaceae bacterium]
MSRIRPFGIARAALFLAALSGLPFLFAAPWQVDVFIFVVMYGALAVAWNLVGGFSGYISLGHAAFFGLGAYAIAIVYSSESTFFIHGSIGSGYRPFFVLPLIGIGAALASIPIGLVAFRTRAATFAIVTISMLFAGQQLAYNLHGLTGGSQGLILPEPTFNPYERPFYFAMLGILALSMLTAWYVRGSKLGLALYAIRDDEDRARGLGVQTKLAKLTAFALSAALVAMAGGVWAYYSFQVYPGFAFDPLVTIGMVLMAYLGGRGTLWGPVLGAFILVPAQRYFQYNYGASQLYLIGYSAVFLIVMLLLPRGILPSFQEWARRLRSRRSRVAPPTVMGEEPRRKQAVAS